jgi:aminoglycoside/choline kinase family phosphotransferase
MTSIVRGGLKVVSRERQEADLDHGVVLLTDLGRRVSTRRAIAVSGH